MKKIILPILFAACLFLQSAPYPHVTLCFVGDIMLDRDVKACMEKYGIHYPYTSVTDILAGNDIAFGNLECPLTGLGTPAKSHGISFRGDTKNAAALRQCGFDILNLANNHILDYGPQGLHDTMKALDGSGIAYTITGCTILKRHGIKVGFMGYSNLLGDINEITIKEDITKAKSCCDFLVVSFHWGMEYNPYPAESQKKLARLAIAQGADLVVGHHPHVLQGMEEYRGKYIFYSLGNFIFDKQIQDGTDESVILKITIDNSCTVDSEIIPVAIKHCRPQPAIGEDKDSMLQRFKELSDGITPP